MKKLLGLLMMVVLAACETDAGAEVLGPEDLPQISYTEVFDQEEEEYFVLFWQPDCTFMDELWPDVLASYERGSVIYAVNMRENTNAWYDWEAHHEEHSQMIGEVVEGQFEFFDDINPNDFPIEEGWAIEEYNEDGYVWARLNNALPFINRFPATPDDIGVAGTPTMMRVYNGTVGGYAHAVEEGRAFFEQFCPVCGVD